MSHSATLKARLAGKWQLPLLVVSLAMLFGAFIRVRPAPTEAPIEEVVGYLDALLSRGVYESALQTAQQLVDEGSGGREGEGDARAFPPRGDAELALIYVRMARALMGLAADARRTSAPAGRQIVDYYEKARELGAPMAAEDLVNLGRAYQWQEQWAAAAEHLEQAAAFEGVSAPDIYRDAIVLWQRAGKPVDEVAAKLDTLLASLPAHRLELRLWAVEQKFNQLRANDRIDDADALLRGQSDWFRESDLAEGFAYLEALLQYEQGDFDGAETHLRAIRNRISTTDEIHAKAGWLLGRVVLGVDGPQRPYEAMAFFRDVVAHHPRHPYATASYVGLAEALAMLERHDEAVEMYRIAIDEMRAAEGAVDPALVDRDVLRVALAVLADKLQRERQEAAALKYAELALSLADVANAEQLAALLQQVGQLQQSVAARLDGETPAETDVAATPGAAVAPEARNMFAAAAVTFARISQIQTLSERRSADASWTAAELFVRAGQFQRAADLYDAFARERPLHPLVPRARLRLGQVRRRMGDVLGAIDAYRDCFESYPRTLDGARALVPLAQCYLSLGPDGAEQAERTLQIILGESEIFTPEAPEFADALFLLGEVQNRRGHYEEAIGSLEEALDRYPEDARVWQARSLLADSYRQSGLALRQELAEAASLAEIDYVKHEVRKRLRAAQEHYRAVINGVRERSGEDEAALQELRLARLNEADCLFELGLFREALQRYEEAAGIYKATPTALAAYVQIINCHVFLGQPDEARAALARARVLADAIPQPAFDQSLSPVKRRQWQSYFEWLEEAELF